MYQLRIDFFPNNEIRQTLTKIRVARDGSDCVSPPEAVPPEGSSPLTLLSNSERSPSTSSRKPTRFGNNARRALLRSGGALDKIVREPGEIIFLTGTIPGSTPEAYQAMADYAHLVVDRLKSWLSKRCASRYEFYVWELQKRGALHLHYAVHLPNEKQRESVLRGFKSEWCRLLNMVGKLGNVNMYRRGFGDYRIHGKSVVQAYAQPVRKSVAAYLAKYCSKEAGKLPLRTHPYYPKRWWGRSRPLKSLTESLTKTFWLTFSKLSQARSKLSTLHDDIGVFAVKSYAYQHYCGVGETSLNYVLPNLWKEGLNWIMSKLNGLPGMSTVKTMYNSKLHSMLVRLTDNFLGLATWQVRQLPASTLQLLKACSLMKGNWSHSDVGAYLRWIDALCKLSIEFPANKFLKQNPGFWDHPEMHPVRFLWKIREYLWTFHSHTWDDVKSCDYVLDKLGYGEYLGTNSPKGGETQSSPEPIQGGAVPVFEQLSCF